MPAKRAPKKAKRNATETRARILLAAQEAFAQSGYASVGIRDIAKSAGVASSLLMRYFGSKSELFEDALINAFYNRGFFVRDRERFGAKMVDLILSESDVPMMAMIVHAHADPVAREITQKLAQQHILAPLAEWLGPPNAKARALNMLALMTGFFIYVHQLAAKPVPAQSRQWLARQLQAIADG